MLELEELELILDSQQYLDLVGFGLVVGLDLLSNLGLGLYLG
jgi:hypothetical protein